MQIEEKVLISAPIEKVFSLYANVAAWSSWDVELKSSSIDGQFSSGASGTIKPLNGPQSKITFTEVVPNRSFTVESKLPLCLIRFEHELLSIDGHTQALHRVSFIGLLAPLFGRLIGAQIRKGLPHSLSGLKRAAQGQSF